MSAPRRMQLNITSDGAAGDARVFDAATGIELLSVAAISITETEAGERLCVVQQATRIPGFDIDIYHMASLGSLAVGKS